MMTLVTIVILAWASFAAPCIEIGFFWGSAVSALVTALIAWRTAGRISQRGMLLVYSSLAASIVLSVTSLTDMADFTFLGYQSDAESGMLLGSLLAFMVIGWIAVRLSERFPASLAWGLVVACLSAWGMNLYFSVQADYQRIITMAGLGAALFAFICVCRCRRNLNNNQYISVLSVISVFVMFCAPSSSDNLMCSILASLVMLLSGILILGNWQQLQLPQRIAGSMLLYAGFSGCIGDTLKKYLHFSEMVSAIPTCLLILLIVALIRLHKQEMERGLYWVAILTFSAMLLLELMPESTSGDHFTPLVGVLLLFITAGMIYAPVPLPEIHTGWKKQLGNAAASVGVLFVITMTAVWLTLSLTMLTTNYGAVRLLALLEPTPLWPGDQKFIELVMRDESLWYDEVRSSSGKYEKLSAVLKRIRPTKDRFSSLMAAKSYRDMKYGFDEEDIGVVWGSDNIHYSLKHVDRQSPAGKAGLGRGDRVVAINGKLVKDIPDDMPWEKAFGDWKAGSKLSMNILDRTGIRRNVSLTIGMSVQDQPMSKVIPTADGPVGYLYLEGFSNADFRDMKKHFSDFNRAGVHSLVLDLRYNSGGIIDNASLLTDLIAGQLLDGKPFIRLEHAERVRDRNIDYVFERMPDTPYINRLVVLTTDETCSASEAVINGLKPYMPVTVVGTTTCGKPFSMGPLVFGEKIILPVSARIVNSNGEGHYIRGIRPDILATDDLTHQLGDPRKGMLKKGLEVLAHSTRAM